MLLKINLIFAKVPKDQKLRFGVFAFDFGHNVTTFFGAEDVGHGCMYYSKKATSFLYRQRAITAEAR